MPRLATSLIKKAKQLHPLLPLLLRACRSLESAQNELRWLTEYQRKLVSMTAKQSRDASNNPRAVPKLHDLCLERSKGRPLQYILGTQPFCGLEILCRKGVLIPRPETEAYTTRLIEKLISRRPRARPGRALPSLRILDLGTGTGCILMSLVSHLHSYYDIQALGIDISSPALRLAKRNLRYSISTGALPSHATTLIQFHKADMLDPQAMLEVHRVFGMKPLHLVISNPPYILPQRFRADTERSVRLFEPHRALLTSQPPSTDQLTTHERILAAWCKPDRANMCVIEFVDEERALLFAENLLQAEGQQVEIWRDGSTISPEPIDLTWLAKQGGSRRRSKPDNEDGRVHAVVGFTDAGRDWYHESNR